MQEQRVYENLHFLQARKMAISSSLPNYKKNCIVEAGTCKNGVHKKESAKWSSTDHL